jgi:hypothetical protein
VLSAKVDVARTLAEKGSAIRPTGWRTLAPHYIANAVSLVSLQFHSVRLSFVNAR